MNINPYKSLVVLIVLVGCTTLPSTPGEPTWTATLTSPTLEPTRTLENVPTPTIPSFTPTISPTSASTLVLTPMTSEPAVTLPVTLSPTAVSTVSEGTPSPEFLVETYEQLLTANQLPGKKTIIVRGKIAIKKAVWLSAGTTLTGWDVNSMLTNVATYAGPIMQIVDNCPSALEPNEWNVVVYNMRFDRTPTPGFLGPNGDAFSVVRSCNVWLDHNSFRHGSDGNLDLTDCTRCKVTNNIIAEAIRKGFHRDSAGLPDEHSMGMIITDCTDCLVAANMFVSNKERNPRIDGCFECMILNNLIVNPRSTPTVITCSTPCNGIIYSGNVLMWRVDNPSDDLVALSGMVFTNLWVDNRELVRASDHSKLSAVPYTTTIPQYRAANDIMPDVGAQPRDGEDARLIECSIFKTCEIIDWS